jgi:hypothetical protein
MRGARSVPAETPAPHEAVVGIRARASWDPIAGCRLRFGFEADPDPLATAELEAEEALGEHRQEDEAAREHRLADRDRGKGERDDVQGERRSRHAPADAPPLRAKEIDRAAQRMAHVDVGAATAPLYLNRKARFVASADSSAQMSPRPTAGETPVTAGPSSERSQHARALPPALGPSSAHQGTPSCVRVADGSPARRRAKASQARVVPPLRVAPNTSSQWPPARGAAHYRIGRAADARRRPTDAVSLVHRRKGSSAACALEFHACGRCGVMTRHQQRTPAFARSSGRRPVRALDARCGRAGSAGSDARVTLAFARRSEGVASLGPGAWTSSGSGASSAPVETLACQSCSGATARVACRPLLAFVQPSSKRDIAYALGARVGVARARVRDEVDRGRGVGVTSAGAAGSRASSG